MADPSALPPIPSNIANLTTPILVGALLDYFLFGILTLQLYVYQYSFPEDKLSVKLLIWFVYILELAQVCCAAADIYYWFGAGYGNMIRLDTVYISPFDTPFIGSVVAFVVQLFFCYRIWKLRKGDWYIVVCVIIALISVLQLIGGTVGGVSVHFNKYFDVIRQVDQIYAYIWLVGEAVADVLIAVTMTYLLLGSQSEFNFQSRSVANKIVRLVVQSNSLTASVAVTSVIFFVVAKGANYFIASTIILGKLYSNTLLATFNHRIFLRRSVEKIPYSNPSDYTSSSNGRYPASVARRDQS
ncbi:hypothetical protein M378DRAFT_360879 [Amanita muscaria Koide BX008]|uniref:DUF6534 domain-containing protein n=1 Tax=Amanita muscaria (strain Koide BX008) TaxID=946122 RepID=A0A0C2WM53_AMAMK|nr:hypothetical protein M378DRAFT_360879 [Amanita muscaria Koide BX008]